MTPRPTSCWQVRFPTLMWKPASFARMAGVITADIHVNLVRDAQGQPQLLVGQVQDITARKLAEEDRHRRGELLRLTFDNAPIGMAITGLDRGLIRCNTALAAMLGYTRAGTGVVDGSRYHSPR